MKIYVYTTAVQNKIVSESADYKFYPVCEKFYLKVKKCSMVFFEQIEKLYNYNYFFYCIKYICYIFIYGNIVWWIFNLLLQYNVYTVINCKKIYTPYCND